MLAYSNLYPHPPVEEPENSLGRAFFSKWKIPWREAFLDWKFQGGGLKYLQNAVNSMGGG